jgi:hypothetical protein
MLATSRSENRTHLPSFSQGRDLHSTNFGALLLIKMLVSSVAIPIKILLVSSVLKRYSYFGCRPPSPQTALSTAPITALGSNRTACMATEAPPTLSRRLQLGWDRIADTSNRAAFCSDPTAPMTQPSALTTPLQLLRLLPHLPRAPIQSHCLVCRYDPPPTACSNHSLQLQLHSRQLQSPIAPPLAPITSPTAPIFHVRDPKAQGPLAG